ncbi:MAG: VanZ family protein [Planctomycetota bacterium]
MIVTTLARAAFAFLFIAVTYLTLTPNPEDTEGGMAITRWIASLLFGGEAMGDKVAHFLAYAALAGSAVLARARFFGRLFFTVAALAAYGAALEGLQGFTGVRTPDPTDALANMLGALSGYPAALLVATALSRRAA